MNYREVFEQRLTKLNDQQLQAVNYIEGTLMVVAGPGTGKTELLAMRVANILAQTDTIPSNILCLTFTDSAANNMVERLAKIIGPDAYSVNIQTFHSFGSSIIGRYGEYFYRGADFQPASPLMQRKIIADILLQLPFDHPLSSRNVDGTPVYLSTIETAMGDFKKSGLSPDELVAILQHNLDYCQSIQPIIADTFDPRIDPRSTQKTLDRLSAALAKVSNLNSTIPTTDLPPTITSYGETLFTKLSTVLEDCTAFNNTKPFSEFKSSHTTKDTNGNRILKDQASLPRLLAAVDVYRQYLDKMSESGLYDFNDMILQVISAIKNHPDLKANLQEQYQYILVDEFQDTNDAQMILLDLLTDYDDQPNLMVVGDDDQAIYRFQGANISNIQSFAKKYPRLAQINLEINYRSDTPILQLAEQVASDIAERLTNIDGSPKRIIPHSKKDDCQIEYLIAEDFEHEYNTVADKIEKLIKVNHCDPGSIAVIAKKNIQLETMSYYLAKRGIDVNYERKRNIFESELIKLVLDLANVIVGISQGKVNQIENSLSHIIASPAFGFDAKDFYQISLAAPINRQGWMTATQNHSDKGSQLVDWLMQMAQIAENSPLGVVMAALTGITDSSEIDSTITYRSPIYDYYFSIEKFQENGLRYLNFLEDYNTLLTNLTDFNANNTPRLIDLLRFVDQCQSLQQPIFSRLVNGGQSDVHLLTAHKAKGMEFDTVFIVEAESEGWGSKQRHSGNKISYTANLPLGSAGDTNDERLRLFFVAITRAKHNLFITAHTTKPDGKGLTALEYLLQRLEPQQLPSPDVQDSIEQKLTTFLPPLQIPVTDQRSLLADRLQNYRLSATDLNKFTDLVRGGPEAFFTERLLRIPQPIAAPMIFGTAMHAVMEYLHNYVGSEQHDHQLPTLDQTISLFERKFQSHELPDHEIKRYHDKGVAAIQAIFEQSSNWFQPNQRAEIKLNATLPSGIKLTGKIDMADIDKTSKTITVCDYKTGKPFASFNNKETKAISYRQQLLFYKLLIENSPEFAGWSVNQGKLFFIEPIDEQLFVLDYDYSDRTEIERFDKLVASVWNCIINLEFPDISQFEAKPAGSLEFENWLIDQMNV